MRSVSKPDRILQQAPFYARRDPGAQAANEQNNDCLRLLWQSW